MLRGDFLSENLEDKIKELNDTILRLSDSSKKNEQQIERLLKAARSQKRSLKILKRDFDVYRRDTDKVINSYNEQLETIFLYYDLEVKGLLKFNQILNHELLDFVVNVCNKYDLDYWLDFGTLLGAYRHKGFIPWDDDVDIGMMRKDYEKLVEVIPNEIKENNLDDLIRISRELHTYKIIPALQLLYHGGFKGVILAGIDIFPYDYVGDISNCNAENFKSVREPVFNNIREGVSVSDAVNEFVDKFNVKYNPDKYIIPDIEGPRGTFREHPFVIFDTDKIFPLRTLEFRNKHYKVPKEFKEYLEITYNDYDSIPKVIHHHHKRFERLNTTENVEHILKKNILKLQEANASY